jgi:hypothetical protein
MESSSTTPLGGGRPKWVQGVGDGEDDNEGWMDVDGEGFFCDGLCEEFHDKSIGLQQKLLNLTLNLHLI